MSDSLFETSIKNITMNADTFQNDISINGYKPFDSPETNTTTIITDSKVITKFEIHFTLRRDPLGYLIRYHLICGLMVFIGSISFLIEPNIVPGRSGLLVTIFLVLATIFSNAEVVYLTKNYANFRDNFFTRVLIYLLPGILWNIWKISVELDFFFVKSKSLRNLASNICSEIVILRISLLVV